jgi:hypothetical protein
MPMIASAVINTGRKRVRPPHRSGHCAGTRRQTLPREADHQDAVGGYAHA